MAGGDTGLERVVYAHLDRDALDLQLSPSRSAKDAIGVLQRHEQDTARLWDDPALETIRDVACGPAADGLEAWLDIVRPAGEGPFPCLAFIHGGFWQEGSKAGSGFASRDLAERGWATALIGYTLTPQARLPEIVAEIAQAVLHLHDNAADLKIDPRRLVLAGHSAGGHLAATILAGLGGDRAAGTVCGAILISGVYDLAPVAASYVNELAGIEPGEVDALSPLLFSPVRDVPVRVLIGADEPDAFQRQSDALHAAWAAYLADVTLSRVAGRDHFDILDTLAGQALAVFAGD